MRFVTFAEVARQFAGKSVAIVGSGPAVLGNEPGFVDSHDLVVRVNNYRCGQKQGTRADVHYAFYGSSIRKTAAELQADGVKLCICKCPDAKPIESAWHEQHSKQNGIDFRYIYRARADWWFCDTYVPTVDGFITKFRMLDGHIPTTGFSAILDVLACEPARVYLTGFDFFRSGVHNVNDRWVPGDPADPIGHRPELEAQWLGENARRYPLSFDRKLKYIVREAA